MLPFLLALATLTITPTIQFTSDSVYKKDSILSVEIRENLSDDEEHYLISKDLILKENHLLGYTIYDNKDTEYIDGLKVDGKFVYAWKVEDFDDSVEHLIQLKTVYTDDAAGMLVAAKDGDWSRLLSNPLIIIQLFYYLLAAVSIIAGGFGLFKSRKKKVKTSEEIAAIVSNKALEANEAIKAEAVKIVNDIVSPVFNTLNGQNESIIKALILAQSGDKDSKLALVDLLKNTSNQDVNVFSETIIKSINEAEAIKQKAKEEANKVVKEIASGEFLDEKESKDDSNDRGGIAI